MGKTPSVYSQDELRRREKEEREAYFEAFDKETDRGLAIASVCYLDDALEKLIRATYRKDPGIKILFRNNQILQHFFNKACISYFSGLIPKAVYDDLILVGEIRNKFAHSILETRSFNDVSISKKIDEFKQLPPDAKREYPPRLKFLLIIVHIGALLRTDKEWLSKLGFIKIGGMFDTDATTLQRAILTRSEIEEIGKRWEKANK